MSENTIQQEFPF